MSPGDWLLRSETWPILLLVPFAALGIRALDRRRARRIESVLGPRADLVASRGRVRLRWILSSAALGLALLAILQPTWGRATGEVEHRGVDILVCLDVSRSMLADDVPPSRLLAARREIETLADASRGDRLGLVVFAGEARLIVPLTKDRDSFRKMLETADPLAVGKGGTDLGAALSTALEALRGMTGEHEAVLLLTDGEDHEGRGAAIAKTCADWNIAVHAVGFGSTRGAKIAIEGEGGETFLEDPAGRDVLTSMDPAGLRRIAEATGGDFVDASTEKGSLVRLYEDSIAPMARKSLNARERRERSNRYSWALLPAYLLWILGLALPAGRRSDP